MSIWVVGTDTSVGKTVVSALILSRYMDCGSIAYWKPVSTGGEDDRDFSTMEVLLVGKLQKATGKGGIQILEETYHFDEPVSPHLAARLAGETIDPEKVLEDLVTHGLEDQQRNLLIEGAGGLLVPLNEDGYLLLDLIVATALPVVLVARSTLGTINHTLLSLEALRARHVEIAGVVLNGPYNRENALAIERLGRVQIIGEVPLLLEDGTVSSREINQASPTFDTQGILEKYFSIPEDSENYS